MPCTLPQLHPCQGGRQRWKTQSLAAPTRTHHFWKPDLHGVVGLLWQKFLHRLKDSLSKPNLTLCLVMLTFRGYCGQGHKHSLISDHISGPVHRHFCWILFCRFFFLNCCAVKVRIMGAACLVRKPCPATSLSGRCFSSLAAQSAVAVGSEQISAMLRAGAGSSCLLRGKS